MKKLSLIFVVLLGAFNANAEESSKVVIDTKDFYFGGGGSFNSLSNLELDDGFGYQVFAGYKLPVNLGKGALAVEIGYMDSGDLEVSRRGDDDAEGAWSTAVISHPLVGRLGVLARAGYDFGDDDGFMFGSGLEYQMNEDADIRGEYVVRDHIDSLQVNLVIRL